ncbi:hypothetical protein VCHE16_3671, partial [Vibrio paracholerae HE-16]
MFYWLS